MNLETLSARSVPDQDHDRQAVMSRLATALAHRAVAMERVPVEVVRARAERNEALGAISQLERQRQVLQLRVEALETGQGQITQALALSRQELALLRDEMAGTRDGEAWMGETLRQLDTAIDDGLEGLGRQLAAQRTEVEQQLAKALQGLEARQISLSEYQATITKELQGLKEGLKTIGQHVQTHDRASDQRLEAMVSAQREQQEQIVAQAAALDQRLEAMASAQREQQEQMVAAKRAQDDALVAQAAALDQRLEAMVSAQREQQEQMVAAKRAQDDALVAQAAALEQWQSQLEERLVARFEVQLEMRVAELTRQHATQQRELQETYATHFEGRLQEVADRLVQVNQLQLALESSAHERIAQLGDRLSQRLGGWLEDQEARYGSKLAAALEMAEHHIDRLEGLEQARQARDQALEEIKGWCAALAGSVTKFEREVSANGLQLVEISARQNTFDDNRAALATSLDRAEQGLEHANLEIRALYETRGRHEQQLRELARCQGLQESSVAELRQELFQRANQWADELGQLRSTLVETERALEQIAAFGDAQAEQHQQIERCLGQANSLQQRLETLQQGLRNDLQTFKSEQRRDLLAFKGEYDAFRDEMVGAQRDLHLALFASKAGGQDRRDEHERQQKAMQAELEQVAHRQSSASEQLAEIQSAVDLLCQRHEAAEAQLAEARQRLEHQAEEVAYLRVRQAATPDETLDDLDQRLQGMATDLEGMRTDLTSELEAVTRKLAALHAESQAHRVLHAELEEGLDGRLSALPAIEGQLRDVNVRVGELRGRLGEVESELGSLVMETESRLVGVSAELASTRAGSEATATKLARDAAEVRMMAESTAKHVAAQEAATGDRMQTLESNLFVLCQGQELVELGFSDVTSRLERVEDGIEMLQQGQASLAEELVQRTEDERNRLDRLENQLETVRARALTPAPAPLPAPRPEVNATPARQAETVREQGRGLPADAGREQLSKLLKATGKDMLPQRSSAPRRDPRNPKPVLGSDPVNAKPTEARQPTMALEPKPDARPQRLPLEGAELPSDPAMMLKRRLESIEAAYQARMRKG